MNRLEAYKAANGVFKRLERFSNPHVVLLDILGDPPPIEHNKWQVLYYHGTAPALLAMEAEEVTIFALMHELLYSAEYKDFEALIEQELSQARIEYRIGGTSYWHPFMYVCTSLWIEADTSYYFNLPSK